MHLGKPFFNFIFSVPDKSSLAKYLFIFKYPSDNTENRLGIKFHIFHIKFIGTTIQNTNMFRISLNIVQGH